MFENKCTKIANVQHKQSKGVPQQTTLVFRINFLWVFLLHWQRCWFVAHIQWY